MLHCTKLERPDRKNYDSLLGPFISNEKMKRCENSTRCLRISSHAVPRPLYCRLRNIEKVSNNVMHCTEKVTLLICVWIECVSLVYCVRVCAYVCVCVCVRVWCVCVCGMCVCVVCVCVCVWSRVYALGV